MACPCILLVLAAGGVCREIAGFWGSWVVVTKQPVYCWAGVRKLKHTLNVHVKKSPTNLLWDYSGAGRRAYVLSKIKDSIQHHANSSQSMPNSIWENSGRNNPCGAPSWPV